jgi:hypothetical protein
MGPSLRWDDTCRWARDVLTKRRWKLELFRDTNPNWDDLYPSIAKL